MFACCGPRGQNEEQHSDSESGGSQSSVEDDKDAYCDQDHANGGNKKSMRLNGIEIKETDSTELEYKKEWLRQAYGGDSIHVHSHIKNKNGAEEDGCNIF